MLTPQQVAIELLARRKAREQLQAYITYCKPKYIVSTFSKAVCAALDTFLIDVEAGKRPILILKGPPQHGKSEIASRQLPAFIMGRFPSWRIAATSYADFLAGTMSQDVRRNLASTEHRTLFKLQPRKDPFALNRQGEFSTPGGTGSYIGVGIGAGLTGRPVDIGIIDDPTKDQEQALSQVTKESQWNWYQSVFTTRLSERSGQIIMATSWAEDDLPGRILDMYKDNPRLTLLRFPAINLPDETGYNPDLPQGALVSGLHSLEKLYEDKASKSDYWWSAMYQQSPKALGGNVFKEIGIQHYLPKDLPEKFDTFVISFDCTFKDTDGTDFVVGLVLGKRGSQTYVLDMVRDRMSFTATVAAVVHLHKKWPQAREILIEDKANGPAVIDTLKKSVPGIIPIEPDGSKLARAHAVTSYWEALNIFLPDPRVAPWIVIFINELTHFPTAAHDDIVDAFTQALRRLYPQFGRMMISPEAIARLSGRIQ